MASEGNRSQWRCSSGHELSSAFATPFTMTTTLYTYIFRSLVHLTTYCIYTTCVLARSRYRLIVLFIATL